MLITLLIACAQRAPSPTPTTAQAEPSAVLVAAAASLQGALEKLTPVYQQEDNRSVNYTFAASGALQQQIEQGAPVDVFISAAEKQMDALEQKDLLLADTRQPLLTNQLVLVTPKESAVALTDFRQLTRPEVRRIAIGEPRSVPAGQYATQVLESLGVLAQVQSKFVLGNSVKSVLGSVETGDAEAGIVYITDAKSSDRVKVAAIASEQSHSPIRYPIAVVKSTRSPDAAKQYVEFLRSDAAKQVFEQYGFGIAGQ